MPTGKQNTFANKTLPNYAMIAVRTDTPVNLVSAFEDPVTSKNGYVAGSISRLEKEYKSTLKFVDEPVSTTVLSDSKYDSKLDGQVDNISELIKQVTEALTKVVQDENPND
ncbi:MAG: type I-E CRISPR-associated protein Cas7/Cse4/CasC, partial [Lentilactobacillus parabuchneri]|nr:type I-E CRISPR-associated protein Cas7/Cse4/CasC [Lentilactobacillus parabuchneri]